MKAVRTFWLWVGCAVAAGTAATGGTVWAKASPATPAAPIVHGLAPLPGGAPVPLALRPPGATAAEDGPSKAIFPPQTITLRFNHEKHVKRLGMTCTSCHDQARTSKRSADSLLPPGTRCDACHLTDHRDLSAVTGEPGELIAQCAYCHRGYEESDGNRVARMIIPKPNLKFDHAVHVSRNIGCQQCHGAVQDLELATRDQLPRMKRCFGCHQMPEPARGEAKGACETCHLQDPDGVLKTQFASGQMMPPQWLQGAAHDADWLERHKAAAGNDSQLCANCHREDECVDCHDGRVRPRDVHPNDFISMHPIAAKQAGATCTSCHQTQSFCVSCHQRSGVTMSGPIGNAQERGRFHPPADEFLGENRGPRHHAWEAQRNMNACVSCHLERDCASCHSTAEVGGRGPSPTTGIGRGTNPHPPGFRSRCRTALRKNARPCLVCHVPEDPKLSECR